MFSTAISLYNVQNACGGYWPELKSACQKECLPKRFRIAILQASKFVDDVRKMRETQESVVFHMKPKTNTISNFSTPKFKEEEDACNMALAFDIVRFVYNHRAKPAEFKFMVYTPSECITCYCIGLDCGGNVKFEKRQEHVYYEHLNSSSETMTSLDIAHLLQHFNIDIILLSKRIKKIKRILFGA